MDAKEAMRALVKVLALQVEREYVWMRQTDRPVEAAAALTVRQELSFMLKRRDISTDGVFSDLTKLVAEARG